MLLMGKSTISMAIFNSYVNVYQRVDDPVVDFLLAMMGISCWFYGDEIQVSASANAAPHMEQAYLQAYLV